jgi:hypothetical protein
MAKLTVKANVFMVRTEYCLRLWKTCGSLPLGAPLGAATLVTGLSCMVAPRSCRLQKLLNSTKAGACPECFDVGQ